jgi:hypothetical protein
VEGTHRELGSGFADGLRRDDSRGFAQFDQPARRQVASVAHHANSALRFASQHRADFHPFDTGCLNRAGQVFGDLVVDVDDHPAVVILDFLKRHAAHNAVAQRFDDLAGFDDTGDVDAIDGAAIVFADDYVLCHVNQTPRQVA